MALTRKVLWIVNMDTAAQEAQFLARAQAAGIDTLCVRTSSTRLPTSIATFKAKGLSVYAWRWPSAIQANAMAEADKVVHHLIPAGLDGYIVDPESDGPGSNDWDQPGLGPLARAFCARIRSAAPAGFRFGTTSGCTYPGPNGKPHLPFTDFFAASDALFPQTYWRWTNAQGRKQAINGGSPAAAIARGLPAWQPRAGGKPIIPMAGEVDVVTPAEIAAYGAELARLGVSEGHFYTDSPRLSAPVLAAIKAL